MKRTRRIEVVRYTRRVGAGGGEVGSAPGAAEAQAVVLLLEAAAAARPEPERVCDCERRLAGTLPTPAPRPGLLRRLAVWLRPG